MGFFSQPFSCSNIKERRFLAAYCYSWPTFFSNKKHWENKKNVKNAFFILK